MVADGKKQYRQEANSPSNEAWLKIQCQRLTCQSISVEHPQAAEACNHLPKNRCPETTPHLKAGQIRILKKGHFRKLLDAF